MDDLLDEFIPLTGISPSSRKNIPLSQVSSTSRLSLSYIKSKKKNGRNSKTTHGTMRTTGDTYQNRDAYLQANGVGLQFCPICQAPFDIMKVEPFVHVNQCHMTCSELEECPKGETCFNYNLFHYRDYSHKVLAQIRASKGHLPQKTTETRKRVGCGNKQLSHLCTPSNSDKKLKRTYSDVARGRRVHLPANQSDEQEDVARKEDTFTALLQAVDKKHSETDVRKCNVNGSYSENGKRGIANDMTRNPYSEERSNKDLKSCVENLTSVDHNYERSKKCFQEQTYAKNYSHECNLELKLDRLCNGNGLIKNGEMEPCAGHLHAASAAMSSELGENKLKLPVNVDSICGDEEWEMVGTAELQDAEVSLHKCAQNVHEDRTLSQKHTVTSISGETVTKTRKFESEFFSNAKELALLYEMRQKGCSGSKNRQTSITSYFKILRPSSSLRLHVPAEGVSKDVGSSRSSWADTSGEECMHSLLKASKHGNESAKAHWKQILNGMKNKGLSTMSVMSDDSITVSSDGRTNNSNLFFLQQSRGRKTCPSYKRIPETSFVVDAFQYGIIPGISHYFLSHFHSDHYGGLRKSFSKPIFCSKITAALVKMKLHVDERYLHVLDLDVPQKINGVLVTALDANHCPGSVMFLFQLQDGRNFLHVGDFRADPKMESYPCFWNLTIDKLYLDTTYCEPRYSFPIQSETVAKAVELALQHHRMAPATLFVCGTYTLGKEKVFLGIVEALNCKLWARPNKRAVLECINNEIINKRLTHRQWEAQVHICPMSDININFLQRYLNQHRGVFTHIVAFIPTGWEMSCKNKIPGDVNGNIKIYGVPYSEHSSFTELKRFVQFLKPAEVIPTVNVERFTKKTAMMKYFRHWLSEPSVPALKRKRMGDQYVQQKVAQYIRSQRLGER